MTTLSLVPQVIRVWRLRSAREISLAYTLLFLMGVTGWLGYGVWLELPPVILWNAISVGLGLALLYAKMRYGR